VPGLVTSAIGLFSLTYALIEAHKYGWGSTTIITAIAIAVVFLGLFVLLESRQRLPMLDLSLFKNRTFSGANTVMLLVGLAMFGVFFYMSLFMQQVLGYSATQTGAAFLPMTVLIILVAPQAGRLSDRIGSRGLIAGGMLLLSGSLFLFSRVTVGTTYWALLVPMLLGGLGMGLTMTPTTAAAMGSVPRDKAGVGSAVLNSMRQVGGSLGIAVVGTIVASGAASAEHSGDTPQVAFVHGLHSALEVAALIALAGAVLGFATVRKIEHHEPEPEQGTVGVETFAEVA
jgi:predicted MFS family arabinose efflux permease